MLPETLLQPMPRGGLTLRLPEENGGGETMEGETMSGGRNMGGLRKRMKRGRGWWPRPIDPLLWWIALLLLLPLLLALAGVI